MPSSVPVGGMRTSASTTSGFCSFTASRSDSTSPHSPTISMSSSSARMRAMPSRAR